MSENLYCPGQKKITQTTKDGWTRIYKGYPPMNDEVKKMIYDYVRDDEYAKLLLFFTSVCEFDDEYSSFLMREAIRGYI